MSRDDDQGPRAGDRELRFGEHGADGSSRETTRAVAVEAPVAVEVAGLGYAVMMVTPRDLEDFGVGFALAERLIAGPDDLASVDVCEAEAGLVLRLGLIPGAARPALDRVRRRTGDSSCGLCGVSSLEALAKPLPRVPSPRRPSEQAVFAALGTLRDRQSLGRRTAAVHAAAFCTPDGRIETVREDVGRHNALDKLIGARLRQGLSLQDGFVLLTSRCSYELVEKAAVAGLSALVTVSLPTTLAIERAAEAGLPLLVLARDDSFLTVTDSSVESDRYS
ncbi:formate dehydrogenase accessory sulfurtransferase FdhD [Parvularcula dongshanensis]|uniref:Sulfur carrier protein FdhD n=1 Tax=Parvularcula dongshanensis TaxID=1173995 RepID=A0A840I7M6_9PROT|nr:formate dehydrogenase accessory sulfurtransferase FdhD [Parvularcula dongshanensis]MBB4660174.1 FdhD protein [Parvularcula dongshanensis]